jgi:predicted Zn-dependent protease
VADVTTSFTATGFHPSLEVNSANGHLVAGDRALRFEFEGVSVELPFDGLQIELGGHNVSQVFFAHPQAEGWTVTTGEKNILKLRPFRQLTHLRSQIEEFEERQEGMNRLRLTAIALVVFAVVSVAVIVLSGHLLRGLVDRVPPGFEKELGAKLALEVRAQGNVLNGSTNLTQLNNLVAQLLQNQPATGFEFKLHLLDDPMPNAFAIPGGQLFVNQGLLDLFETREEVAGVMAHEISHVTKRHGLRQIVASAGPALLIQTIFDRDNGLLATIAQGSQVLVRQSFSRDYEREADDGAWDLLVAAKIDPRGLANGLRKLKAEEVKQRMGLEIRALSSHPPTDERIEHLEERWKKLGGKSKFTPLKKDWPKKLE